MTLRAPLFLDEREKEKVHFTSILTFCAIYVTLEIPQDPRRLYSDIYDLRGKSQGESKDLRIPAYATCVEQAIAQE